MPSKIPIGENSNGISGPGLIEPKHHSLGWTPSAADEVQGLNNVNGTLVRSIPVPAGQTLYIFGVELSTKVAAATFAIQHSNLATLGGVATLLKVIDIPAAGSFVQHEQTPILVYFNNTAVQRFVNLFITHTRAAAATGDAATQYVSGSVESVIVP